MDKILKDGQIKSTESLLNKIAHFEIKDNDLVITIDFENERFAALQFLQLIGKKGWDEREINEVIYN